MARHRSRGNRRLGLVLALATAFLWGFLSIALRLLLEAMDAFTITWYRLSAAALLLGLYQARRGKLPSIHRLRRSQWALLGVALLGLVGNYVLFVLALDYVSPATAQLVIQLAPLLFLLGALAFFGERFRAIQWIGLLVLLAGLGLFFNRRIPDLLRLSGPEAIGAGLVVVAAVVWSAYALAQKQLLVDLSSVNILLLIYIGATLLLVPLATPRQIVALTPFQLLLLIFGVFNTLAAYGCFAEALEHWDASRVSAIIALTPLVTLGAVYALLEIWPHADIGERLDRLGAVGAALIIAGSVMAALGSDDEHMEAAVAEV